MQVAATRPVRVVGKKLVDALVQFFWLNAGRYPEWAQDDAQRKRLCEMFHCLPSQLDGEDWHTIQRFLALDAAEMRYLQMDADVKSKRRKGG